MAGVVWSGCAIAGGIDLSAYTEPENTVKRFAYTSSSWSSNLQVWEITGEITLAPSGTQSIEGKEYQMSVMTTQDLPDYYPSGYQTGYRHDEQGIYTISQDNDGAWIEHLVIPAIAEPGKSWQTPGDYWDIAYIESIVDFDLPDANYKNCLQIKSDKAQVELAGTLTQTSIICPAIGNVKTIIEHHITEPPFKSTTIQRLIKVTNM